MVFGKKQNPVKQEDQLRRSIELITNPTIKIVRGPLFIFGPNDEIQGCDAVGAVLLAEQSQKLHFEPGWLKETAQLLDVDTFWLWRFWMGWTRNYQVLVEHTGKGGHTTFSEDEVAKLGIRLAKDYAK